MDEQFVTSFWSKVDKGGPDECWLWTAGTRNGYGVFWTGERTPAGNPSATYAHRFSYNLHVGPIRPRYQLHHECRNRRCVNPAHLTMVTARENAQRGKAMQRGERNGSSVLREVDIPTIRAMYDAGDSCQSIAEFYGVNTHTIWDVAVRETWKHVA